MPTSDGKRPSPTSPAPAGGSRTPRQRRPNAATPDRILDAARRVFIRKGTDGARVQEIAAEAGVTQALVHYYFGTKEALAERVFLDAASNAFRALAPLANQTASLEAAVEQLVHVYIDTVRQTPFLPAYVLAEAHHHPQRLSSLLERAAGTGPSLLFATLQSHVEAMTRLAIADGTMRPIPPRQLLVNVMALLVFPFVARPLLLGPFGMDEESFEAFLNERRRELPTFILQALKP